MRKKFLLLHAFVVSLILSSCGQTNFLQSKNAYLGQPAPGEEPVIFAKNMLVDSGIVLGKVQFTKDGKAFCYSFARHWFDNVGAGTKEIKFEAGHWQQPTIIANELTNPAFSPDEKTMYLGAPAGGLWRLNKTATGWSAPSFWMQSSQYGIYNFQATNSGRYYLGSNGMQGNKQDWSTYDFCTMTITGTGTLVQSLGDPLNTAAFDGDFFIAADESYIIISAKETPNYECELWISFSKKDKTWTQPQSLGDKINNGLAHRFGQYVSPDGKYLFFTKGTSEADCAIYWVKIDETIARLRTKVGVE